MLIITVQNSLALMTFAKFNRSVGNANLLSNDFGSWLSEATMYEPGVFASDSMNQQSEIRKFIEYFSTC